MIYKPSMKLHSKPVLNEFPNEKPLNEDLNFDQIYEDLNTKYTINNNAMNN